MFCIFSNWLSSPIAFGITLVSGLIVIAAVLVLSGGHRSRQPQVECPDPECGHLNPPHARYCARCGRDLTRP